MKDVKLADILSGKAKDAFEYCFGNVNENDINTHINVFAIDRSCEKCFEKQKDKFNYESKNLIVTASSDLNEKIPNNWDVYVTKNLIRNEAKNAGRRFSEDFKAIKNIVIDLDCHYEGADFETIKTKFVEYYDEIFDDIPEPTVIYWSGRGFHIWYNIETVLFEDYENLYRAVSIELGERFKKYLTMFELVTPGLEADISASQSPLGLIRLFNSHNAKAQINPEICVFNKVRYNLVSLANKLNTSGNNCPRQDIFELAEALDACK